MEDGGEERRSLTQLLEARGQSKYAFTFSLFIRFRWVWKYDTCIFGMPGTRSVVFLPHLSRQSTSKYIYEGESLFYSNQMIRIANKKACLFEELWSSISRTRRKLCASLKKIEENKKKDNVLSFFLYLSVIEI